MERTRRSILSRPVYTKNGRVVPPDDTVVDDFARGIDREKWNISAAQWGGIGVNNGVRPENVGYTEDGVVILRARGRYAESLPLTGAALFSRALYGPGKYEIAVRLHPRLGVCNAFWTFYMEADGAVNHEIDIELPGHDEPGDKIGYRRVLNTNWRDVDKGNVSRGVKLPYSLNDGGWHTFGFDWHTAPPRVTYYADGAVTSETTEHVPDIGGLLWLGVWLPNKWCGEPDFAEDCMLVDWVAHEPNGEPCRYAPYRDDKVAPPEAYPARPSQIPESEFVVNGRFQSADGWEFTGSYSTKNCVELAGGARARQIVAGAPGGRPLALSALASGNGRLCLYSLNERGEVVGCWHAPVTAGPARVRVTAVPPLSTDRLSVVLEGEGAGALFDEVSLRFA